MPIPMCLERRARREGWALFEAGENPDGTPARQMHALDDPCSGCPGLASDRDAWNHVVEQARAGSALHLSALDAVDPIERKLIAVHRGDWRRMP